MKKSTFLKICLPAALGLASAVFNACNSGNEPNPDPDKNTGQTVADPVGTITVTMRNGSSGNTCITPDNCGCFYINSSDNFTGNNWKFATIGKMKGLGNITQVPAAGFAPQVSVAPGYGYVGVYTVGSRQTYIRLYVTDWVVNTSDGIIGAEVKYAPLPYNPNVTEITLSKTVIDAPAYFEYNGEHRDAVSEVITISPANWTITSDATWCWVHIVNVNSFQVICKANIASLRTATRAFIEADSEPTSPRTATLTVKIEGLPDKTITVLQQGYDGK